MSIYNPAKITETVIGQDGNKFSGNTIKTLKKIYESN